MFLETLKMKKKLFKKADTSRVAKTTTEKANLAVSTMPSYMLNVCGTNIGTTNKVPDDLVGDKAILSSGFSSDFFEEEKSNINKSSKVGNILGRIFGQ